MRRNLLVLAAAAALLAGCSDKPENVAADDTGGSEAGVPADAAVDADDNQAVAADAVLVMLESADPIPDVPNNMMTISDVAFVTGVGGHFITADVNHSGCPPYQYKAYWDGSWRKSKPPGMEIVLRQGAAPGGCKPNITQKVQINITEAVGDERRFWVRVDGGAGEGKQIDVAIG